MSGRLASKVVVVTGGGTGIGRAVASRVVSEGAAGVIGGRRADMGEEAADGLRRAGGRARFAATDVTVEADVERLVKAAMGGVWQAGRGVQQRGWSQRACARTKHR